MKILAGSLLALATALTASAQQPAAPSSNAAVCALFSIDDAQKIMGGTLKAKPNMGATVCMYELTEGYGTVALTLIKSSDGPSEDRAWASIKETRHLQQGQKNTRPVAGIGEEAWFDGGVKNGKAGASSIVVRKGNAHFAIDVMTLDYRASPQEMTAIAERIALSL